MNCVKIYLCAGCSLLFTGCTAFKFQPNHPAAIDISEFEQYWIDQVNSDNLKDVAWGRMRSIDLAYNEYANALYSEKKKVNFIADSSLAALAGLTTLGTKAFTSKEVEIFGLISGLITASRASLNSEVYYNRTIDLIVRTMNDLRRSQKEAVLAKLDTPGVSANEVLYEVDKYFEVGSLSAAIDFLNSQKPTEGAIEKHLSLHNQAAFHNWKAKAINARNNRIEAESRASTSEN